MRRAAAVLVVLELAAGALTGCGVRVGRAPTCGQWERLGLIAQAVPSAAYLPCVATLPPGWSSLGLSVRSGGASFRLASDRSQGRTVSVSLARTCDAARATPVPPRSVGGRSSVALRSIRPRYTGALFDVFPGGCVTTRFDFPRGAHIALYDDLTRVVGLLARTRLRGELHRLGVQDPP